MSEEPEVSPLRLKRPGAGGPPPGQPPAAVAPPAVTPPLAPSPEPVAEAPLIPLPGMPPAPAATVPPPANMGDATHPSPIRRRPSLASDAGPAPAAASGMVPPPATAPAPGPAPAALKEIPPGAPSPGASAAPAAPATGAPAFKLKVGTRPLPPLPPAAGAPPPSDALPPLEDSPGSAPLLPLPGLPSGGTLIGGLPPTPPLAPLAPTPPPEPSPAEGMVGGLRTPIHLRAEAPAEALDPAKLPPALPARAAKAAVGRSHARRDALIFGLIFLVVAGAGAGAYFYFTDKEAAADAGKLITEKINQAAQLPGKAVDDAKNALAGVREKEQTRVDAVTEGKEPPADRAIGNIAPGDLTAKLQEKNASTPPASTTPANNQVSTTPPPQTVTAYAGEKAEAPAPAPAPVAAPPASARFLRYAEGIRVSGVFQGNPGRALVDGRLIREGDLVEPTLGIKFVDLDPDAKQLILQDGTGAQVRVKY